MQLDFVNTIQTLQRQFQERMTAELQSIDSAAPFAGLAALMLVGFVYGVLHAIGPGHGKVVVAGYMLADAASLRRGLIITALASLLQAVVAVSVVLVVVLALGLARAQAEMVANWIEVASFALLALVGALLLVRGVGMLVRGHHHTNCDCGHSHAPAASDVAQANGFWPMAGIIVSIGARPCSGALLMMVFALLVGRLPAGIAATFAMAVGTALTTGAVAIAAAHGRKGLMRMAGASERRLHIMAAALRVGGGVLVLAVALLFMAASWPTQKGGGITPVNHPLMRGQN